MVSTSRLGCAGGISSVSRREPGSKSACSVSEPLPGRGKQPIMAARAGDEAPLDRVEDLMDDDVARAARAKKGSPFLSTEQAAFYLGLSPRKLQEMRAAGTGPGYRRHSRYVRYHIDDLDTWSRGVSDAVNG
jgi:hypothetical protein